MTLETVVVSVIVLGAAIYILNRINISEIGVELLIWRIQGRRQMYHESLERLKRNPSNQRLRQKAYERGMRYGELMNRHMKMDFIDEDRISSDIDDAIAGRYP